MPLERTPVKPTNQQGDSINSESLNQNLNDVVDNPIAAGGLQSTSADNSIAQNAADETDQTQPVTTTNLSVESPQSTHNLSGTRISISELLQSANNRMTTTPYGDTQLDELLTRHKMIVNTLVTIQDKLHQHNYESWNIEFPAKMRTVYLWDLVDKKWSETTMAKESWIDLDGRAKDNLLLNLTPSLQNYVRHEKTANAMYAKLHDFFEGSLITRGWQLCKQLTKLLQSQPEKLDQIAFEYQNLVDKFNDIFPTVPNEFYISLFCALVPGRFDYILSDVLNKDKVSYAEIIKLTMLAHSRAREKEDEQPTISNCGAMPSSQAFSNKQHNNQNNQFSNQRTHNVNKQPTQNSQQNVNNKTQNGQKQKQTKPRFDRFKAYFCEYCQKPGHSTQRCTLLASAVIEGKVTAEQAKGLTQQPSAHKHEENPPKVSQGQSNNEKQTFRVNVILCNVNESYSELDPNGWYIDDGAANVVTNSPAGALELIKHDASIRDWENRITQIDGVGKYKFTTENGHNLIIDNVLYKKTAAANFLSYSKLDRMNIFRRENEDGIQKIFCKQTGELVMTATLQPHGLYQLQITPNTDALVNSIRISNTVPIEYKYRYWHNKLGHGSFGYIKKISKSLGIGSDLKAKLTCDTCVLAKATKLPFPRSLNRASDKFELVHTDLSGIIRVSNPEGFNYFLLFMDDLTRYLTVFLLSRKFQVEKCYRQYRNWAKVQFGKDIKCLRSDNGGEFKNQLMDQLTTDEGTNRQLTVHHNPAQNSRAERQMRSIEDIARALLKHHNLHIKFWPYAVLFAVQLKNILPQAGIDFQIPYELMFGTSPDYHSLLEFGIRVFVILPIYKPKFANRTVPAIFLGYPQGVKGHFVYLINEDRMDISRDVYLSEEAARNEVHFTVPERELSADLVARFEADRDSQNWFAKRLFEFENESVTDLIMEEQEFCNELEEQVDDLQFESVDPAPPQQQPQPESAQLIGDVINLRDLPPGSEQPKGRFIMNKTEKMLFQERFPESKFTYIQRKKANKPGKHCIWSVNAMIADRIQQPPRSYEQAISVDYRELFCPAMDAEIAAQFKNRSWTLVERPPDTTVYPMIWLYSYKTDPYSESVRGKARLVVLGNRQIIEIGENNYAPVMNVISARTILSLAVTFDHHIHHLDCDTAFLNADVQGDIFCYQPKGYITAGQEHLVCRMNRAMYGLRQSPRRWYLKLRAILIKMGFKQLLTDSCVYVKRDGGDPIILGVFVDDLLVSCRCLATLNKFKADLAQQIAIKDHGPITKFLGLSFKRDQSAGTLEMSNQEYIESVLKEANFDKCHRSRVPLRVVDFKAACSLIDAQHCNLNEIDWYQRTLGQLMYLTNLYRFDIAFAVSFLCGAMHNPTKMHLVCLKQLLRYLRGTSSFALRYSKCKPTVEIYADSSFEEKNSRHGLLAFIGNNLVSWISRKQYRVATSTCEAEILSILDAVNEAEYLRSLLIELEFTDLIERPITIYNDNKSAQGTITTGGDFSKSRHYRNRVNRITFAVDDRLVEIKHAPSTEMLADVLTKPTGPQLITKHCQSAGLFA